MVVPDPDLRGVGGGEMVRGVAAPAEGGWGVRRRGAVPRLRGWVGGEKGRV